MSEIMRETNTEPSTKIGIYDSRYVREIITRIPDGERIELGMERHPEGGGILFIRSYEDEKKWTQLAPLVVVE